jgi:hypothetical protein
MEAPRIRSLFRNVQNEPRQFNYRSRFYDPRKEELEKRKKRIERKIALQKGDEVEDYNPGEIRFSESWKKQSAYRSGRRSANLRLVIILGILVIFSFLAIQWLEGIDGWLELFE